MPREWDATTYDALPLPHEQWGRRTLGRLAASGPRGDERVLDLGCGTGRDTAALLDLLPDGHVVAVDGSLRMLDRLRRRLAGRMDRVEAVHADITRGLPLREPVDAVVSVATLHWIPDHTAIFGEIARVLRPGGTFVAECGGLGNIAQVSAAVEDVLGAQPAVWHFAGVADTEQRLREAGFTDVDVALVPDPARLVAGDQLLTYLAVVVLGGQLERLPEDEHQAFVRAVAQRLPEPVVDYVRLTISARRGRSGAPGA
ncbi:class I SAM-dependent methyltransferase [Streptomyces sp. NPDC058691]|uniref:class I SAM-dependent methyltransferase n=1 Tax=Streptomyces sp. NPDC058691 TaxID=3346601 RepID=UPI003658FDE3